MNTKVYQARVSGLLADNAETAITISESCINLKCAENEDTIDYAFIKDMEEGNFKLILHMSEKDVIISQLGYDFEGFSKELFCAYNRRCLQALFVEESPLVEAHGEYSYKDDGGSAYGDGDIFLYQNCLCILSHSFSARRIPLCFVDELTLDNYIIKITLDTNEYYELIRLGRATENFYEKLGVLSKKAKENYNKATKYITANAAFMQGEGAEKFKAFQEISEHVSAGVFEPCELISDATPYWIAAINNSKACVELVTDEKAATYLYRFDTVSDIFSKRLNHAMEAMGTHREIIAMEQEELSRNTLYLLAIELNAHLRFLRNSVCGRVIHTNSWNTKLTEYMK